jgi:hypothetical protein
MGAEEDDVRWTRKWNVTAECQMIVLPQKVALPLLPELLDEAKIEGAFAKLQELIASGTAQLAANLLLKSRDGEKAVAESIEELRYGTEFDPPQLPQNAPNDPAILKHWPVAGVTPTAFETRNVGATLEIEVNVAKEGALLDVAVIPLHVRFLRWAKTDAGRLANGERLAVEQPIFHTMKNISSLSLRNGQRVLLGVHKLTEPADTLELFILRVTVAPIAKP